MQRGCGKLELRRQRLERPEPLECVDAHRVVLEELPNERVGTVPKPKFQKDEDAHVIGACPDGIHLAMMGTDERRA